MTDSYRQMERFWDDAPAGPDALEQGGPANRAGADRAAGTRDYRAEDSLLERYMAALNSGVTLSS